MAVLTRTYDYHGRGWLFNDVMPEAFLAFFFRTSAGRLPSTDKSDCQPWPSVSGQCCLSLGLSLSITRVTPPSPPHSITASRRCHEPACGQSRTELDTIRHQHLHEFFRDYSADLCLAAALAISVPSILPAANISWLAVPGYLHASGSNIKSKSSRSIESVQRRARTYWSFSRTIARAYRIVPHFYHEFRRKFIRFQFITPV